MKAHKSQKSQNNKGRVMARYGLFVAAMLLFSGAILWCLVRNAVIDAKDWNARADSILTEVKDLPPVRGKLLADDGSVIAANMHFYIVRIDWESARKDSLMVHLNELSDSLSNIYPELTPEQWQERLTNGADERKANGKKNRAWRLVPRLVTSKELERIKTFPFLNNKYGGLNKELQIRRCKPFGTMAARSIGNVGENDSTRELHGTSGLEKALDSLLYGTTGKSTKVQLNRNIVDIPDIKPVSGYDITTTINVSIQDIVENELYNMLRSEGGLWGTAIVMEVATGEIKAISNLEKNPKTGDYFEGTNHAVIGYEPGSVMKPISMMVALEDGIVTGPNQVWQTGTTWNYCGSVTNDPHGGASLMAKEIIERSSNVGISKIIVKKYGPEPGKFRDRLEEMGFFEPLNLGIAGEQTPTFRHLKPTNGDRVALTRSAFGYATLIPPVCTLAMFNAIANDGKYVRPRLVKKLSRKDIPDSIVPVSYIREQVCTPQNARYLREMMHEVVWGAHGTARKFLQDSCVHIAGKTGTAYIVGSNGQYTNDHRYAFCGYFPEENPKYTCMVLIWGGGGGAAGSSGMVLKNVALKMYSRGLLGNESVYVVGEQREEKTSSSALLYSQNASNVKTGLGISKAKVFSTPEKSKSGVPDVKGLSVREAITRMEHAGINVRIKGTGHVTAQSLAPGSAVTHGSTVTLTLSQ